MHAMDNSRAGFAKGDVGVCMYVCICMYLYMYICVCVCVCVCVCMKTLEHSRRMGVGGLKP